MNKKIFLINTLRGCFAMIEKNYFKVQRENLISITKHQTLYLFKSFLLPIFIYFYFLSRKVGLIIYKVDILIGQKKFLTIIFAGSP